MTVQLVRGLALASVLALGPTTLRADELATQARTVLNQWQEAVVTVQLVATLSMAGGGADSAEEIQLETLGMVVDPSGLVVVAHSKIDPSADMNAIMAEEGASSGEARMSYSSQIKDVKFRMQDGKEIPGKVALRDRDLNLAFLKPDPPLAEKLTAIDLKNSAAPNVLDPVVFVGRLGKVGHWTSNAVLERIQARIDKPRTLFVPTDVPDIGCPAFDMSGKIIGLSLIRISASDMSGGWDPFSSPSSMGFLQVIIPADQILEAATQALEGASGDAEPGK